MTVLATTAVADTRRSAPASAGGTISVSIDALDSYIEELNAAYWVVNAPSVDIPVILSEPWPEGSVGIPFISNTQPGSVVFSGGATRRTHTLVYPTAGAKPFYPGWTIKFAYFSLLADQPPGIERGIPYTLYPVQVQEIPSAGTAGIPCGVDWICALAGFLGWPNALCDAGHAPAGTTPVTAGVPPIYETLRRYRDDVLDMTTSGQYYMNLYDQHSVSIIRAMAGEPSLAVQIWTKKDPWLEGIEALVNGQGNNFTVTQQMEDDLLDLLGAFEQAGSPSLAGMIAQERTRLQLDTIAGQSMSEYQTQIETLGGPMAVENRSWGDVKRVYR
jgi:hypothetical protein